MSCENQAAAETPPAAALELARFCADCIADKKGENTVLLPLAGRSTVADYFVISTAGSEPQLQALVSHIERQVREKFRLRPLSQPGGTAGGWVLLDFSDVIVHLMTQEVRERYNLEAIWGAPAAAARP